MCNQRAYFINDFGAEPIGSPLVRVLFTKGMIAADFLGDPTGTIARSSITAPVTATSISIVHSDPLRQTCRGGEQRDDCSTGKVAYG